MPQEPSPKELIKQANKKAVEADPRHITQLIELLEEKLTDYQIKIIKAIGHTISSTGLPLEEACLLARISKFELEEWSKWVPEIKTYVRLKQVEYKFSLLKIINNQAKENADVKMATWLLEKNFAEEFDTSYKRELAKLNQTQEDDVLDVVMAFVRKNQSKTVPIDPANGEPLVVHDVQEEKSLKDILS